MEKMVEININNKFKTTMVTPADPPPGKASGKDVITHLALRSNNDWILVNIVLGMPQRNCQYHGICRIELDDLEDGHCTQCVRAGIRYRGQQLAVRFRKEQMSEAMTEKHFASGHFIVLTDYTLPEPLRALFRTSLVIRRGIYPVRETAEHYIVHF